jgi:hypothetical protein
MKINRSSKLHFSKWLTEKKKLSMFVLLIGLYENHEAEIPNKKKMKLMYASHIQNCIKESNTFLTARLIKNAFAVWFNQLNLTLKIEKLRSISDLYIMVRK